MGLLLGSVGAFTDAELNRALGPTCPASALWSRFTPSKWALRREQRGHKSEHVKMQRSENRRIVKDGKDHRDRPSIPTHPNTPTAHIPTVPEHLQRCLKAAQASFAPILSLISLAQPRPITTMLNTVSPSISSSPQHCVTSG